MHDVIIQMTQVSKMFDDSHGLHPTDLAVRNGEFLTLLGPSGCGKTTLLRLLSGFETPDQGRIVIKGQDVTRVAPERRHINMVFQSYALFPHMSVYDNVAFGLQCKKMPAQQIQAKVNQMLTRVKLTRFAARKPSQLSGGQRQRVAIARAAVNEPLVLLLDEPLSALDYHLRRDMQIELKKLQRDLGITFVLVTHDQEEALSLSDRIAVMNHGYIEQLGTPRDIYEEPKTRFVASFIGLANMFNTQVDSVDDKQLSVSIADSTIHCLNQNALQAQEPVCIVIRPEDIQVYKDASELEEETNCLPAVVSEAIYKGCTVDLIVKLNSGQQIFITKFFDEDDDKLDYQIGDSIIIRWPIGWEVVLREQA